MVRQVDQAWRTVLVLVKVVVVAVSLWPVFVHVERCGLEYAVGCAFLILMGMRLSFDVSAGSHLLSAVSVS